MRNTRRAISAAVLVMALLGYAGVVAAQTAQEPQKPAEKGAFAAPKSPNGWYTSAELENAVRAAEILGQPLALMYQDSKSTCPKHNGQRDSWMRAGELAGFVRILAESGDPNTPHLIQQFRQQAGDRAGQFIPMLFLGKPSGEFLGVVPYNTPQPQLKATAGEAVKTFGGVLPPKTALELWKKLELARKHWKNGKTDAALTCYLVVKREESKNPKLAIFDELRKDEGQINQKGAEEVAAAKALFDDENKRSEARAAIATIRRRYVGFQPAKDAKTLLDAAGASSRPPVDASTVQEKSAKRTWSDVSGKHQTEAELVAVNDDSVRLKKVSGDYVNVSLRQLSRDDQKYIKRWQAQHANGNDHGE